MGRMPMIAPGRAGVEINASCHCRKNVPWCWAGREKLTGPKFGVCGNCPAIIPSPRSRHSTVAFRPARIDPRLPIIRRENRFAEDVVRRLLAYQNRRRV